MARYIGQRASVTEDKRQVEVFISRKEEKRRRRRRIHSEKFFLSRQMNLGKLNGQFGGGSASPFQITFIARNVKENFRKCKTCQKVIMEIDIHSLWL